MPKETKRWKKGRGKLGVLAPLLGNWSAFAETPMGTAKCTRTYTPVLSSSYIELTATWEFGKGAYVEHAMIGVNREGVITFWSFTNDGKNSIGHLVEASDIHLEAIAFEAEMPAGLARMAYWPDEEHIGFYFVVESKNKKGWNRFLKHHYLPNEPLEGSN